MRVISGTARGKKLTPVPGMDTRPTTDRVKESMFNIIQNQVYGARVLDLFAGTGQLGIEALSRGAAHCDFVDFDKTAQTIARKNIDAARVSERAHLHKTDFTRFVSNCAKGSYDLIFLDPPYGGKILAQALSAIERFDILSETGIIVCESAAEDTVKTGLAKGREYRYGAIKITIVCHDWKDGTDNT